MAQSSPGQTDLPLNLQLEHQPSYIKAGFHFSSHFSNVRSQCFVLRFAVSELLKFNGNALYKSGDYLQASEEYEKSLSIFRYIRKKPRLYKKGLDEDLEYIEDNGNSILEKSKILALKLGLYLNLSLCYLIMGRCFNALRASQEALKLDHNNTKALYRSAKAKIMNKDSSQHELISAKDELDLALKQQPNDQMIRQELNKLLEDMGKKDLININNENNEIPMKPAKNQERREILPKDIEDLDMFVRTKGQDIVKFYEKIGKFKEAEDFRGEIQAALEAKDQIEKIGMIDFDRPNEYLREITDKYKIDLKNPSMKMELLRIQNHNIKELRQWMNSLREINTDSILNSANTKDNIDKNDIFLKNNNNNNYGTIPKNPNSAHNSANNPNNANNFFINNNFFTPSGNNNNVKGNTNINNINNLENNQNPNNFGPMDEEKLLKWIECQNCKEKKPSNDEEEEGEISGIISCLNCSLWVFTILFIFLTIVFNLFA